MYQCQLRDLFRYILFRLKARNEYQIHSPYLFDLYVNCFRRRSIGFRYWHVFLDCLFLLGQRSIKGEKFFIPTRGNQIPPSYSSIFLLLCTKQQIPYFYFIHAGKEWKDNLRYSVYKIEGSRISLKDQSLDIEVFSGSEYPPLALYFSADVNLSQLPQSIQASLCNGAICFFEVRSKERKVEVEWRNFFEKSTFQLSLDLFFARIFVNNSYLSRQSYQLKI